MFLDIFILVVAVYALWKGWTTGLLHELISMLGFIVGLIVACCFYGTLGKYLSVSGSEVNMTTSIVAFLILWIVVPIAMGTVATFLTKLLNKSTLLSMPNKVGGAAVSFLKYMLLLSCILNVMSALGILAEERKESSALYEAVASPTTLLGHHVAPADTTRGAATAIGDTVWIENPNAKAKGDANNAKK